MVDCVGAATFSTMAEFLTLQNNHFRYAECHCADCCGVNYVSMTKPSSNLSN